MAEILIGSPVIIKGNREHEGEKGIVVDHTPQLVRVKLDNDEKSRLFKPSTIEFISHQSANKIPIHTLSIPTARYP